MSVLVLVLVVLFCSIALLFPRKQARSSSRIAAVKRNSPVILRQLVYRGGDWDANPGSLRNLARFASNCEAIKLDVRAGEPANGRDLPGSDFFVYATGHHGFDLAGSDLTGFLSFVRAGGFVLVDDNRGMDAAFRRFVAQNFPEARLEPVRSGEEVFRKPYNVGSMPKIMIHDGSPAVLYRLKEGQDLNLYYSFSSDLGDGWEDSLRHRVPEETRRLALEMGTNLIALAFAWSSAARERRRNFAARNSS